MLDAYIIDKLNREEEQQEQWQPIPLPLEEYDPGDRFERQKKEKEEQTEDRRGVAILQLQSCKDTEKYCF